MTRMNRNELLITLPGATNYTQEAEDVDPIFIVRLLKAQPQIMKQLIDGTTVKVQSSGREREEGNWAAAYLGFVACRKFPDIQPWWSVVANNDNFWRECGFKKGRP